MKKKHLIAFLAISVGLSACTSDEPAMDVKNQDTTTSFSKRSLKDAIEIATQYGAQASKLSRSSNFVVDKNNVSAIVSAKSRSGSDTLMYAVNFEDNNGYMIISAKKATEPVLAIIDEGNYQDDEHVNIDGFNYFMAAAETYLSAPDGGIIWPDTIGGRVGFKKIDYTDEIEIKKEFVQRLKVKYGQLWPENKYCPNRVAGCGPVAIAQVLSYFQPEMCIDVTFYNKPYDKLTIDWSEILRHTTSTDSINPQNKHFPCTADSTQHDHLAILLRQLGVLCKSEYNYDPLSTSTKPVNYFSVANSLLKKQSITFSVQDNFYDHLKDCGIALVAGYDRVTGGGHGWVLDGVASVECKIIEYKNYNLLTGEYDIVNITYNTNKYVHCNWGWAGAKNGYFLEGIFNTELGRNFEINPPILIEPEPFNPTSRSDFSGVYGNIYK